MAEWDCIVVGAGIVGSWAAYHMATAGHRTLLLDQFMLPHTRGSSGGQSRIIRKAYVQDQYAEMMSEAYSYWRQLEEKAGVQLMKTTGLLVVQHSKETGPLEENQASMDRHNHPYTLLPPGGIQKNYPYLSYNDQYKGLFDIDAALLLPSRCLNAVQDEFKKLGGKLQDGEKVEQILHGSPVRLTTTKRSYIAKKVIIAAGPWSKDILTKLGIDVQIQTMPGLSVFFQESDPTNHRYSADNGFPIIYSYLYYRPGAYRFVATFPSLEYPGMVKMVTRGEPPAHYCHPDERDTRGNQDLVDILTQYVKEHLPGLDPTPKIMEPCVYTMTPDRGFIIDRHPTCDNILIAAGFSGHGYMRAPVVGALLKELALDNKPSFDLDPFKLSRFENIKMMSHL